MTNTHWNKDKLCEVHTLQKELKEELLTEFTLRRYTKRVASLIISPYLYKKKAAMIVTKSTIVTLQRKVSRELELQLGQRQSYNRIHRSKKSYNRRKEKRVEFHY